jgi:hypothetical protein
MESFVPLSVNFLNYEELYAIVMANPYYTVAASAFVLLYMLVVSTHGGKPIAWGIAGLFIAFNVLDVLRSPAEVKALWDLQTLKDPMILWEFATNNYMLAVSWILLALAAANLAHMVGKSPWFWGLLSIPLPIVTLLLMLILPSVHLKVIWHVKDKTGIHTGGRRELSPTAKQVEKIEQLIARKVAEFLPPLTSCETCGSDDVGVVLKEENTDHREWEFVLRDGSPNMALGTNKASLIVDTGYVCRSCSHQFVASHSKKIDLSFRKL